MDEPKPCPAELKPDSELTANYMVPFLRNNKIVGTKHICGCQGHSCWEASDGKGT